MKPKNENEEWKRTGQEGAQGHSTAGSLIAHLVDETGELSGTKDASPGCSKKPTWPFLYGLFRLLSGHLAPFYPLLGGKRFFRFGTTDENTIFFGRKRRLVGLLFGA